VFSTQTEVAAKAVFKKPQYEVANIFRAFGGEYCKKHNLPLSHLKVMHAIQVCRTAALGGHRERCDSCGFERNAYNSCRNRHCPKCQALTKVKWLEKRKAELLPVQYFHNVFTLPHEINPLASCNKRIIYNLLFRAVAETLEEFAANTGGRIGFIAILHTWDQKLRSHLHIHCLIPAGFLSFDRSCWIHTKNSYLFSVKALSKVFRGKFIDFLKNSYKNGSLEFPGFVSHLKTEKGFKGLINQLWKKEWVVYSREPFDEPEYVLDYLGRYTHRVAIANHRIVKINNNRITFWYKDRSDGNKRKTITVSTNEFIRRFLLHVLPPSFMRIRHYGFMANRCRKENLALCKKLVGLVKSPVNMHEESARKIMLKLTGIDILACPCCKKGRMRKGAELLKPILENWYVPQTKPGINDSS
jgi:predicted Zn-ribbon and HTH transcriptional regulator